MNIKAWLEAPIPRGALVGSAIGASLSQFATVACWFRDVDLAKEKIANRDQAIAIQNEALKIIHDDTEYPIHPELVAKVNKKLDFWRVVQEQNIVDGETE